MEPAALRVVSVVLLVLSLRALKAYEWAGGPDDNGQISACQGASVAFPWSLAMTPGVEAILRVSWLFEKPGAASVEVASHKTRFRTKHKHRFAFLPNAGLLIKKATPQDSGTYSVNVTLRQEDLSLTSVSRTVTLSVIEKSPAVNEGAVQLRMGNPVKNNVTGDWNVQLLCGRFVDLGLPPRDVRWTMPSGEVRNSSYEDNGTFVLSVSSPVQGGGYSCHLPPSNSSARCLTVTAHLYVDDKDVELSLLEARQRELVQENKDQAKLLQQQATQIDRQQDQILQQNGTIEELVQENKDQADLLHEQATEINQQRDQILHQNGTMEELLTQVDKQQDLILQQNGTIEELVTQIGQQQDINLSQNGTIEELVQANKDQADLLEEQNETVERLKAVLTSLTDTVDNLQQKPGLVFSRRNTTSCVDWLKADGRSGVRTVYVSGDPISVYCDQTTDGGGWIVFQRRKDASVDFYRGWTDYRNGFGDLEGNFWLGLDKLHSLTTSQRYELRVDLQMWNGTKGHATYSGFYVEGVGRNFALHFDNFTGGNAGDSLSSHRGQQFSTKDRDHDTRGSLHCAQYYHGAWWYRGCYLSNLNGDYKPSSSAPKYDGIGWQAFGRSRGQYSMKFSEMKIRPM